MEIRLAVKEDVRGIFRLLKANHVDNLPPEARADGFVTTNMTESQMLALIEKERGITVAEEAGEIVGFAMAASWEYWSEWPFFAYMIERLPDFALDGQVLSVENSYQYGPVCVDPSVRGTGVFERIFQFSLASMKDRFPIMATFINQVNPRSYAAHTRKAGMSTCGTFDYNNNHYYLLACPTGRE